MRLVNFWVQQSACSIRKSLLRGSASPKHLERKPDNCTQQVKYRIDCDTEQPEGQQEEPDDRIENDREQRKWPTEKQQDKPEQKVCQHDITFLYGIRKIDPMCFIEFKPTYLQKQRMQIVQHESAAA